MKIRILLSLALLSVASLAHATPVVWGVNGHTYDVITRRPSSGPITWNQAKEMAEALGGHLVTITSARENKFVARLVRRQGRGNRSRYWLGGYQTNPNNPACEPASCWAWVTGEEWNYTNWAAGEPNNGMGGRQHWLHYWPVPGLWDDMDNRRSMNSFVVEYSVPEPGTMLLLGAGLLGIGARRRMKAKA